MSSMRDRIINFLGKGYKPSHVASIVGCTPAYVTQICKEPEVKDKIEALKEESSGKDEEASLTLKYAGVEHSILSAIENQLSYAELPALTRALEVIGNRQDKRHQRFNPTQPQQPGQGVHITMLNVTLPQHAAVGFQLSKEKEIIEMNGKELSPLSSDGVKSLFDGISGRNKITDTVSEATVIDTEF